MLKNLQEDRNFIKMCLIMKQSSFNPDIRMVVLLKYPNKKE